MERITVGLIREGKGKSGGQETKGVGQVPEMSHNKHL